ncbi:hypothetical protein NAI45_10185, partial [Francisella tularensis subsp. holarctica]|nr:hypothetical protein [Francisella tularensis subsp. holarctica]
YWVFLGKSDNLQIIYSKKPKKIKNIFVLKTYNVYKYDEKNFNVKNKEQFKKCATRKFLKNPIYIKYAKKTT